MNRNRLIAIFLLALSLVGGGQALAQQPVSQSNDVSARSSDESQLSNLLAQARPKSRPFFSLMPENRNPSLTGSRFSITAAAASPPVTGSGTLGRLTKWGGSSFIGDSSIFEDKFGKVGIGTDSPTSKLTVAGLIESKGTNGGVKFPDGTVQTTSASGALLDVAHDQTLMGSGTPASPLGVASPLIVRDLDNPARQPVNFTQTPGGPAFIVPAGKRLVIEFVSGYTTASDGVDLQNRNSQAIVLTEGRSFRIYFVIGDLVRIVLGGRTYIFSQMVRWYCSPGTEVELFFGASSTENGSLSVSGYFVDVP